MDSPELQRMVRDREIAQAKARHNAEVRALVNLFRPPGDVPHTRPGYPDYLIFTSAQWALYEAQLEHMDSMERAYARCAPSMFASVRGLAGRIF